MDILIRLLLSYVLYIKVVQIKSSKDKPDQITLQFGDTKINGKFTVFISGVFYALGTLSTPVWPLYLVMFMLNLVPSTSTRIRTACDLIAIFILTLLIAMDLFGFGLQ